jgi:hypothetical protein
MPDSRRTEVFPIKPATLLNYMIINDLTVGHASFLQNELGGEWPVTARVKTLAAIGLGVSIKCSRAHQGFKQLMNSMHLKYLQAVTKLLKSIPRRRS